MRYPCVPTIHVQGDARFAVGARAGAGAGGAADQQQGEEDTRDHPRPPRQNRGASRQRL